jgi:hypothetical protein
MVQAPGEGQAAKRRGPGTRTRFAAAHILFAEDEYVPALFAE